MMSVESPLNLNVNAVEELPSMVKLECTCGGQTSSL